MLGENLPRNFRLVKKSRRLWQNAGTTKVLCPLIGKFKSSVCMDTVSKQKRSEIMSHVKSKDSKMEILFRKKSGKYFGKPDIVLPKYKTAIFIDSCFWHGCKKHCRIPSVRKNYWTQKIARNVERGKEVSKHYKKQGWKIFRIWEHDIKRTPINIIKSISDILYG